MDNQFRCPVYKKCGGCQLDVEYPRQLGYKQRLVTELLGRYGRVEPILAMDEPLHYRCKVSTAFGYSQGQIITGVWQSSHGRLVKVKNCGLEDPRAQKIVAAIRKLLPSFHIKTLDERSGKGILRFVTIRIGKQSGEILVAFGTSDHPFPSKNDFVQALLKLCPEITTMVRCVSMGLNLLLGRKEELLYGPGHITDYLCGRSFRISARSFFQINPVQTEKLYAAAVAFAGLTGRETVVDAYCGVGTIGILAASQAREVLAVESNGDAVKNAQENARLNGIENLRIFKADAGRFMAGMAAEGMKADVVFTDPPRAGCSREFLEALTKLGPKKIVYISCNPETQERDLRHLTRRGYRVQRIQPVDMFPYTRHIETVVLLENTPAKKERNAKA